jgi:hypothetical protein
MSDRTAISSMPLYTHLDRVEKTLGALGIGPGESIRPEQLFAIDQWHYHGTDAIRAAAEALRLGPVSRVLDVGSGIGGPARYLPTPRDAMSRPWSCNRSCTRSASI